MSKINLPIAELKPALTGLGKIISKRTTLPVLGMIKVDRTKDGWITLTSTDLTSFITVRLEQPAEGEPASILVSHEDIARITKRCGKDELVSIEKDQGDKALIQFPIGNQTAEEHVESLPVEEFPPVPKIKTESVSISDGVRQSLLEALQCASTDETRYVINSAFIDVSKPDAHYIIGTDGRHLYGSNSFTLPLKESVIVPANKFVGWTQFNNDGEWQIRVQQPEKKDDKGLLQISTRRWRFITNQVDGTYPNWRQVIPAADEFKTTLEFDAAVSKSLVQTIERMPCSDVTNHRIGVKMNNRKVSLIGNTSEKETEVEITDATGKGKDVVVFLNRNILVKALEFGMGRADIIDALSPLRFSDDKGRQMIVMPIRSSSDAATPAATPAVKQTPAPESASEAQHQSAPPQAEQPERTNNMPTTPTNGNGTNGHASNGNGNGTVHKPALETAVEQIEIVKASLRTTRDGLNQLLETLKQAQRDHKTSEKEVQAVRTTLEKLQSVRI